MQSDDVCDYCDHKGCTGGVENVCIHYDSFNGLEMVHAHVFERLLWENTFLEEELERQQERASDWYEDDGKNELV